ncbi:MAG: hypothetical protein EOM03_05190 [Clostridia bacterium]|nr:hypothetical protein [Clostridia bacterium]NCC83505.1 hypothetical protein [Clostridia bacterium]
MKLLKAYLAPILIVLIFLVLAFAWPDAAARSGQVTWDYFKEMALIMPAIFVLMGLMEIWIPKDKIQKWLGHRSGIKGAALAFALGTLPTGPLYVAFPMAASLIRKGASTTNMILFLGSWAALKIPQLMVEIKFLGLPFTALRFVLTLTALLLMGVLINKILQKSPDLEWQKNMPDPSMMPKMGMKPGMGMNGQKDKQSDDLK